MLTWVAALVSASLLLARASTALPGAEQRLRTMSARRLQTTHARLTGGVTAWTEPALAGWAASTAVVGLAAGSTYAAVLGLGVTLALLVAIGLGRAARPRVTAALRERGLPELDPVTEHSERRRRRTRQLGLVALVALPTGQAVGGIGQVVGPPALVAVGLLLFAVGALAVLGLAWASIWRFGDERPSTTSAQ